MNNENSKRLDLLDGIACLAWGSPERYAAAFTDPELDRSVLAWRVNSYYKKCPRGASTIVGSGFTTQHDAHRLRIALSNCPLLEDVHVEHYIQGRGWFRESDRGVPESEVYLDEFVKPIQP